MIWKLNDTSIDLAYTFDNLKKLLNDILNQENTFSHYEFSKWCDNLTMVFDEDDSTDDENDKDLDQWLKDLEEWNENDLAVKIAGDIEREWDLNLFENYSEQQLKTLDISQVVFPEKWIQDWVKEINSL
ncbi:hypothetical protein [Fictibacillus barbaricus]|uniref:Uncharacterized protein n=1 Tax=Fictibacillus barbaricus TaxID=182136 RepID=A0ABS2ZH65_9BACL|nr:hypothetical protein [Fictibacillus barbaricus]MBN3546673.1 hypothetical protein [Fictibacillus barbaricus]GGB42862.1 hypothetical protein GCM10007199_05240 [Fictibacillus barbaricus]